MIQLKYLVALLLSFFHDSLLLQSRLTKV